MSSKMFFVQKPFLLLLLLLINLAFSYRLERQSDLEPMSEPANATSSRVLKEEISGPTDNDDNYQPWREWPDRLFPRYHTTSDTIRPTWTVITRSKTVVPSDLSTFLTSVQPSAQLTPAPSASSDFHLSPSPIASDYVGETSSVYLPPPSSAEILTSLTLESSFKSVDLQTPATSEHSTPSITELDSSLTVPYSPSVPKSTPSVPWSSIFSSSGFDTEKFEPISSSTPQFTSSIHPTQTVDLPEPTATAHYNSTTSPPDDNSTTSSPDDNVEHIFRSVVQLNERPEGMTNASVELSLKRVFESALAKQEKSATDLKVQLHRWEYPGHNGTLILDYSVQVAGKYLDRKRIEQLWNEVSEADRKKILSESGQIKQSELLSRKLFDPESPYFWVTVGLLLFLMLLCCFYLGMLVCWCTNRSSQTAFIKKDLNQLSPVSEYSSDTLNTENFIRWRSRPDSKQQLAKRGKSLFKDDLKSSSLSKLRRKEMGSSPSNEFEYISFSSDTTNSSLARDGSIKKLNSTVRHHPYNSQDYQRSYKRDADYQRDYQQDYQDYQSQVIEKSNQLNQPNSIKLLISRGVQNNLLTDDYRFRNSSTKKFPLEIPQSFHGFYNDHVSVLNLSKEKLIPLNQYTSDSSTTTTNTLNEDKYDKRDSSFERQDGTFSKSSVASKPDGKLDSRSSRPQSRSDSRGSPKRLIKKEIIEEFETITTTTTFKNSNRNSPSLSSSPEEALKNEQLNEQTKSIINAIRDELKKFNTTNQHQSTHVQQLKKA